ncbi:MAG: chlorophyll a/b-binding protein [Synechococcaceae cyanobacterium]|nr:chlorophyll a/b-binding protein [Synechococcaceae cyanobacterium]
MARTTQADDTWFQNTAARQIRDEDLRRAERLNGRVAMLGFTIGLIVEAFSGDGILQQIIDLALLSQR